MNWPVVVGVAIALFTVVSVLWPSVFFGRCSTLPYDEWIQDPECQTRRR